MNCNATSKVKLAMLAVFVLALAPILAACHDKSNRTLDDLVRFLSEEFPVTAESSDFLYTAVLATDGRRITLGGTDAEVFQYESTKAMDAGKEMMERIGSTFGFEYAVHSNGTFVLSINISVARDTEEAERIARRFSRF